MKMSKLFTLVFRWRIVIHAGVDGYSRIPVYLHASSNNRATTVLSLFTEAIGSYGLPSRVRSDKGGENYDVGWYMLNHPQKGSGRGSIIAGDNCSGVRNFTVNCCLAGTLLLRTPH